MTTLITTILEIGRDLLGIATKALGGGLTPDQARTEASARLKMAEQSLEQLAADQAGDYDVLRDG